MDKKEQILQTLQIEDKMVYFRLFGGVLSFIINALFFCRLYS